MSFFSTRIIRVKQIPLSVVYAACSLALLRNVSFSSMFFFLSSSVREMVSRTVRTGRMLPVFSYQGILRCTSLVQRGVRDQPPDPGPRRKDSTVGCGPSYASSLLICLARSASENQVSLLFSIILHFTQDSLKFPARSDLQINQLYYLFKLFLNYFLYCIDIHIAFTKTRIRLMLI